METGIYKKRQVDWEAYEADVFVPFLFNNESSGCGANALSLLTGVRPTEISNTNWKNLNDWTDSFMVRFLKKHKFKVRHITKCDVTSEAADGGFACSFISDKHVILVSQLMNKNSGSWSVIHNRLWYHNFQVCSFSGLALINSPSLTCYVVCDPKWRRENW